MANVGSFSPFANSAFQRAATFGFELADEVHSLVDAPAYVPRRLHPRAKKLGVFGLILFGTLISTLGKLAYEVQAVGSDGTTRPFAKPWFLVLLMFIGMSLNMPLSLLLDLVCSIRRRSKWFGGAARTRRRAYEPLYTPLLEYDAYDDEVYPAPQLQHAATPSLGAATLRARFLDKQLLLLAVPTLFDLLGSALLNVGLLAVTASATQMLRQSLLLFAALLGVALYGKRLNKHHVAGLSGCTAGLMMVAAAALASGYGGSTASHNRGAMAAGIGLILASQMVAAGQLLLDQNWYTGRLQLSPLKVVGCEGLLGVTIMLFVVLPVAGVSTLGPEGVGLSEDSWDSLVMIASRPLLQMLLLAYTGSLQGYNICGMVTTGELSAVETSLLQALRTLFVWIINLLIYVCASALAPDSSDQMQPIAPDADSYNATAVPASSCGNTLLSLFGISSSAAAVIHPSQLHLQHQGVFDVLYNSSSSHSGAASALAVAPEDLTNPMTVFPGEPWLPWSYMQAAGFVVLVLAATAYSKGDNERLRKQLQDEAALIMLDQPPSVAGSVIAAPAGRHFMAHMDIDTAAYLRSFARERESALYGITPVPSQHHLTPPGGLASVPSLSRQRSGAGTCTSWDDGLALDLNGAWEGLAGGSPCNAEGGGAGQVALSPASAREAGRAAAVTAADAPAAGLWDLEQGHEQGRQPKETKLDSRELSVLSSADQHAALDCSAAVVDVTAPQASSSSVVLPRGAESRENAGAPGSVADCIGPVRCVSAVTQAVGAWDGGGIGMTGPGSGSVSSSLSPGAQPVAVVEFRTFDSLMQGGSSNAAVVTATSTGADRTVE